MRRKAAQFTLWAILLAADKETFALMLPFLGAYLILARRLIRNPG
jgi:hypothetical protein